MGPFDFLNNIKNTLTQYFQPAKDTVSSTLNQFFPSKTNNLRLDKGPKAPDLKIKPVQAQEPRPSSSDFQSGFKKFNTNAPVATASPYFAEAAQKMPDKVDPFLAAIIALMETGGGMNTASSNNLFNLSGTQNGQQGFVSYPDFQTSLLGGSNQGVQSQGFVGTILNNPAYENFRNTGNLADFFNVYTPPGADYGNPSLEELISRYNALRALFPQM